MPSSTGAQTAGPSGQMHWMYITLMVEHWQLTPIIVQLSIQVVISIMVQHMLWQYQNLPMVAQPGKGIP